MLTGLGLIKMGLGCKESPMLNTLPNSKTLRLAKVAALEKEHAEVTADYLKILKPNFKITHVYARRLGALMFEIKALKAGL